MSKIIEEESRNSTTDYKCLLGDTYEPIIILPWVQSTFDKDSLTRPRNQEFVKCVIHNFRIHIGKNSYWLNKLYKTLKF